MSFNCWIYMEKCVLRSVLVRNAELLCDIVFEISNKDQIRYGEEGICITDMEGLDKNQLLKYISHNNPNIAVFTIGGTSFEDFNSLSCYDHLIIERFWKPVRIELLLNKIYIYKQKVLLQKLREKFNNSIMLDTINGTIKFKNHFLQLSAIEFKTFEQLILYEGKTVSKELLITTVRNEGKYLSMSALYTIIWRIRNKVVEQKFPATITNMHNKGYKLCIGNLYDARYLPGFNI